MNSRIGHSRLLNRSKLSIFRGLISLCLMLWMSFSYAATAKSQNVWYRYYDQKGVANISSSVTPAHIRYGYEILDRNMQVVRRYKPYNVEVDLRQSSQREAKARQYEQDLKLKRAYGSVAIATEKQNQALASIKKQIALQQEQLQLVQSNRTKLKRKEMDYRRAGKNDFPQYFKDQLAQNDQQVDNLRKNITTLQENYRATQERYIYIISRLKAFE